MPAMRSGSAALSLTDNVPLSVGPFALLANVAGERRRNAVRSTRWLGDFLGRWPTQQHENLLHLGEPFLKEAGQPLLDLCLNARQV